MHKFMEIISVCTRALISPAPQEPAARSRSWRAAFTKLLLYPAVAGALFCGTRAGAQEMMRETLTTPTATSTTTSPVSYTNNATDYNLRVGPVKFSLDVVAGIEYIDNISYSEVNRTSDEVVRLGINILTIIPLTKLNTLRFDLGVGFVRYLEHPDATSGDVFITRAVRSS